MLQVILPSNCFQIFYSNPPLSSVLSGLHGTTNLNWTSSNDCRRARMEYGLSKGQTKICKGWTEIMPHVTKAAYLAVNTCTTLFQDRRWNCSTLFLTPKLTPDLITGKSFFFCTFTFVLGQSLFGSNDDVFS